MKVAIILSGCGVRDGSEIHESVNAILSLDQRGHTVEIYAPDKPQAMVVNHAAGEPVDASRNVLEESARIARGQIQSLDALNVEDIDALLLPGGFGAATNLCDFAQKGSECTLDPTLERVLKKAHALRKPQGFMCIAPVIAAKAFGELEVRVTIGKDADTAKAIQAMGAKHVEKKASEVCIDNTLRLVTVPAYMETDSIAVCYDAAKALVIALEELHADP